MTISRKTSTTRNDGGLIQDCTRFPDGNVLLNDVDNHVLIKFAGPPYEILSNLSRKLANARAGDRSDEHEPAFRSAAAVAVV
jgi:hypothetical protein